MENEQAVAWEILRYLEKHPEAKDTTEGIAQWWLHRAGGELETVERALGLLLSQNLVSETRRRGVPPYYEVNRQRAEAIAEILKD